MKQINKRETVGRSKNVDGFVVQSLKKTLKKEKEAKLCHKSQKTQKN